MNAIASSSDITRLFKCTEDIAYLRGKVSKEDISTIIYHIRNSTEQLTPQNLANINDSIQMLHVIASTQSTKIKRKINSITQEINARQEKHRQPDNVNNGKNVNKRKIHKADIDHIKKELKALRKQLKNPPTKFHSISTLINSRLLFQDRLLSLEETTIAAKQTIEQSSYHHNPNKIKQLTQINHKIIKMNAQLQCIFNKKAHTVLPDMSRDVHVMHYGPLTPPSEETTPVKHNIVTGKHKENFPPYVYRQKAKTNAQ